MMDLSRLPCSHHPSLSLSRDEHGICPTCQWPVWRTGCTLAGAPNRFILTIDTVAARVTLGQ